MAKGNEGEQQPVQPVMLMTMRDLLQVVLAGVIVGLMMIALWYIFEKYIYTPVLCEGSALPGRCENKDYFSSGLAMIVSAMAGLFMVVRQRVFRPLLVVLLVTISLWNVSLLLTTLPWWGACLGAAILFGIAYAVFAWVAQLRNLLLAVGVSIVLVVLTRLVLVG